MNPLPIVRTGALLSAGSLLFTGFGAAGATTTFNVTTTVDATCAVTDSGPANLTPTYAPISNTGVGSATSLDTDCTGSAPTVTFSDAAASGTSIFTMLDGLHALTFQISNKSSCDGGAGDNPITEGAPQTLASGTGSYAICAAVITDGSNSAAVAGTYGDTVTYAVSP